MVLLANVVVVKRTMPKRSKRMTARSRKVMIVVNSNRETVATGIVANAAAVVDKATTAVDGEEAE